MISSSSQVIASRLVSRLDSAPREEAAPDSGQRTLVQQSSSAMQSLRRSVAEQGSRDTLVRKALVNVDSPIIYNDESGWTAYVALGIAGQYAYHSDLFRTYTGITVEKFSNAELRVLHKLNALITEMCQRPAARALTNKPTPMKIIYGALQSLG